MTNTGSAPAGNRVGAMGNLRPAPHRQFRLLPVPLDRNPEWNARTITWAADRG
jgi:hypothetical protein